MRVIIVTSVFRVALALARIPVCSEGSVEHQSTDDSGCRGRFDLLQPMTESTESCAHFVSAVPFKTPMQTGPQIKVIDFGMATL